MRTLPLVLRTCLTLVAALVLNLPLHAQLTGEWKTVHAVATNPISDFIRAMACAGEGRYIIMTSSAIYRTTDAGVTWSPVVTRERLTPDFTHVAYPDVSTIVVTRDSTAYGNRWYHGIIETSTDGGASWTRTVLPEPSILTGLAMLDRIHGLACASVRDSPGSLYRTSDGGLTWQPLPMPPGSVGPSDLHMFGADAWAMRAQDLVTTTRKLFRTTDAGATWMRLALPANTASIAFVDSTLAFAAGGVYPPGQDIATHDRIDRTTDGGATWSTVLESPVERTWPLREIAFADSVHGIAAGGTGMIYRTTDGGATWLKDLATSDLIEFGFSPVGIEYPKPAEALVAGTVGAIAYRGRQTLVAPLLTAPTWSPDPGPLAQVVQWTKVAGATEYELQIGDTAYDYNITNNRFFDVPYFTTTSSDTSMSVSLREHTLYIVRVRARNDSLVSDWSGRVRTRTIGDPVVVPMPLITYPSNLAMNVPVETELAWTPIPNVLGYDYRIALDPAFRAAHQDGENYQGTSVGIKRLRPGEEYHARVCARDSSGELSAYSVITFWTDATSSVDGPAVAGSASLRPNVATDNATLHVTVVRHGTISVGVHNNSGAEVLAMPSAHLGAGEHTLRLDLSSLSSGLYSVAVNVDGRRLVLSLVVLH